MKPYAGRRRKPGRTVVTAATLAAAARHKFRVRLHALLASLACSSAHTPTSVLVVLERYRDSLALTFMRSPIATVAAWDEYGPDQELGEVRAAVKTPKGWDTLLAKHRNPERS
jgi:hypothetical protein